MKSDKRENLEKERQALVDSIVFEFKWMIPIKSIIFTLIPYFAITYFGQSLSTFDIVALLFVFCISDLPLPLYRLWHINKRLNNAKQPRFLN